MVYLIQSKALRGQRIPKFTCVRKETANIDIHLKLSTYNKRIMQPIRVMKGSPNRTNK